MKRFAWILMLLAVACSKELALSSEDPPAVPGDSTVVLIGEASDEDGGKLSVVTEDASGYPCVWGRGDELTARTADGSEAGVASLVKGAGCRSGEFSFRQSKSLGEGSPVRLVYPRWKDFSASCLPCNQRQKGGVEANNDLSDYDFACADILYSASDFPLRFKLMHLLSYVCLRVAAPAFEGALLRSITLSCPGAALAGDYRIDYNSLTVSAVSASDYVTAEFEDPIVLGQAPADIWFVVLPCDLSGRQVSLSFNIDTDWESLDYVQTLDGALLEQGKALTISRLDLNPVPGYCPCDSRSFVGEMYAYGQANNYIVQCKDGSVYKGVSYCPVDDYSRDAVIDYRLRGDRSRGKLPLDVKFGWATKDYGITQNVSGAYTPRWTDFKDSGVEIEDGSWDYVVDRASFTVRVINKSCEAGAPVLLMLDARTDEILWGWSFWNIAADGTRLEAETMDGSWWLANMDIGQPTVNFETWCANQGQSSANPDPIWRMVHKYQWGRFLPVFWQTYWSLNVGVYSGNVPAVVGPLSLRESLRRPYGLIVPPLSAGSEISDWLSEPDGALWGNLNSDIKAEGRKSIYDPCPKGWRVPDYRHFYPRRFSESWTVYGTEHKGYPGWQGSKALCCGASALAYYTAGGYIENKILGVSASAATMAVMGCRTDGTGASSLWWSNHCSKDSDTNPTYFGTNTGGNTPPANPGLNDAGDYSSKPVKKASAGAVRCAWDFYYR